MEANYNRTLLQKYQVQFSTKAMLITIPITYDKSASNYKMELSYRPHHIVKLGSDLIHAKWSAGLMLSHRSETRTHDGDKLNGNFLMDLNGAYKLNIAGTQLSLNGRIENVFNKSYELVKFYPMPGRAFYLGLNIKLK